MDITQELRAAGLSATRQRIALLGALRGLRRPTSVDELTQSLSGKMNATTIYRGLDGLIAAGLARRVELGRNHALFEAVGTHHHHAVCTSCGTVEDVSVCLPKPLLQALPRRVPGFARIDTHALEFFGICKVCA